MNIAESPISKIPMFFLYVNDTNKHPLIRSSLYASCSFFGAMRFQRPWDAVSVPRLACI